MEAVDAVVGLPDGDGGDNLGEPLDGLVSKDSPDVSMPDSRRLDFDGAGVPAGGG